jgi:hypothetical protein
MRKTLTVAALIFVSSILSLGQGIRYQNIVIQTGGYPKPTIRVCTEPATGTPCTPTASIFSDSALTQALPNPFQGDSRGNYYFYANPASKYHVQISGSNSTVLDIGDISLPGGGGGGGGGGTFVQVNGSTVPGVSANFNASTPAVPANNLAITFQKDSNGVSTGISGYVPFASPSSMGVLELDGDLGGTAASPQVTNAHPSAPWSITIGGTGASSAVAGFNNLAPPTVIGGLLVGVGVNQYGNLAVGTIGQCLTSNGASPLWAACAASGMSVNPVADQQVIQPAGTKFTVNNFNGERYVVDSYNWSQTPASPSTLTVGSNTVSLAPCPQGVAGTNTGNTPHYLYVTSAGGDTNPNEPVLITGGSCTSGGASGNITFTAAFTHIAGYTLGSATAGAQEAEYTASNPDSKLVFQSNRLYQFNAPLFMAQNNLTIEAAGSKIDCNMNDSCIVMGKRGTWGNASGGNVNQWGWQSMHGVRVRPKVVQWSISPSGSVAGGSPTATITAPTCPAGFYAAIPDQILWLNGASSGVPATVYGTGEFVKTTGGTCTPGAVNGTIAIAQATPGATNLAAHSSGYTLSNGVAPAVEDNAFNSFISELKASSNSGAEKFGSLLMVDNDQLATVEHFDITSSTIIRKDADFTGTGIFGPGPYSINAGIAYLYGGQISGGTGSCVDWWNGNDLSLHDMVCQAYTTFGVRISKSRGGFGKFTIGPNVHFETGSVTNPIGNVGIPTIIMVGGDLHVQANPPIGSNASGNGAGGQLPIFQSLGSQSATQYYYIVPRSSALGCTGDCKGSALPAGVAVTTDPSANNVTVTFDAIPGATSFDILRVASASGSLFVNPPPAPTGTGSYAVTTGLTPATACNSKGLCSFVDNVASGALSSYTVTTAASGNSIWVPRLYMWPGAVVLANGSDSINVQSGESNYTGQSTCIVNTSLLGVVPNVTFQDMMNGAGQSLGNGCMAMTYQPRATAFGMGNAIPGASIVPTKQLFDGGVLTGIKGAVNYLGWGSVPMDMITYIDSNYLKTLSSTQTGGDSGLGGYQRPTYDVGDAALCKDATNGLCMRAQQFSIYVNNFPDNTNWAERFTAGLDTFKVPITTNSNITMTAGTLNLSAATATIPWVASTGVPNNATCVTTGQAYFQTDGTAGQEIFYCKGGVWTQGAGGGGGTVNDQLSNLNGGGTAINVSLLPGTAGTLNLGSSAKPWANLSIGNAANQAVTLTAIPGANFTATLPANTGTIAETNLVQTWSANQFFTTYTSTSANPSATGSFRLGPTDPSRYGCVGCDTAQTTTGTTDMNLIRGNGSSGPALVGDYLGINVLNRIGTFAAGGGLTVQPTANTGNGNGGSLTISGGNGAGTGTNGNLVVQAGSGGSGNTGVALLLSPLAIQVVNNSTTGTSLNTLSSFDTTGKAIITPAGTLAGVIGVCLQNCSNSGSAFIAQIGAVPVNLDNAGIAGDYVCLSATTSGFGTDCGTNPSSGQVVGNVVAMVSGTLYTVQLNVGVPNPSSVAGGAVALGPLSTQTIQPTSGTVQTIFKCPPGAVTTFVCYQFQNNTGANVLSIRQDGTLVIGAGLPGSVQASHFDGATTPVASVGLLRGASADTILAWRNQANGGDITLSKDTGDAVTLAGATNFTVPALNKTVMCDAVAGADAGAKIVAATALVSSGGTVDCTGLVGAQTIGSTISLTTANVTYKFGKATFTCGTGISIQVSGADVQFSGLGDDTVFDCSSSTSTTGQSFLATGDRDYVHDIKFIGNRITVCGAGTTCRMGGGGTHGATTIKVGATAPSISNGIRVERVSSFNAGFIGISMDNCNRCSLKDSYVEQSFSVAYQINSSQSAFNTVGNIDVIGNRAIDGNVGCGVGISSPDNCGDGIINIISTGGTGVLGSVNVQGNKVYNAVKTAWNGIPGDVGTGKTVCSTAFTLTNCTLGGDAGHTCGGGGANDTGCGQGIQAVYKAQHVNILDNIVWHTSHEAIATAGDARTMGNDLYDNSCCAGGAGGISYYIDPGNSFAAPINITSINTASNISTLVTASALNLIVGTFIKIAGTTAALYDTNNGTNPIAFQLISVNDGTKTYTFRNTTSTGALGAGGTIEDVGLGHNAVISGNTCKDDGLCVSVQVGTNGGTNPDDALIDGLSITGNSCYGELATVPNCFRVINNCNGTCSAHRSTISRVLFAGNTVSGFSTTPFSQRAVSTFASGFATFRDSTPPWTMGRVKKLAQTAALTNRSVFTDSTTTSTTEAAMTYNVCYTLKTQVIGTGNVTINFTWTDENGNARTHTSGTMDVTSLTNEASRISECFTAPDGTGDILYTTGGTLGGGGKYDLTITTSPLIQ